jgi:cell division protein FtsB
MKVFTDKFLIVLLLMFNKTQQNSRAMSYSKAQKSHAKQNYSKAPPWILSFAAMAVIFFTIVGNHGLLQLLQLNNELHQIDLKSREVQSEIVALANDIHAMENSDFILERYARESLGLSKRGEIVYIFPKAPAPK